MIAAREAASKVWRSDRGKVAALTNLGIILDKRAGLATHSRSADLDGAIKAAEQALKLVENGLPKIVCSHIYLSHRFDLISNDENDLDRAIQILKDTLSVMPDSFSYRHLFLAHLSDIYQQKYEATEDKQYLNDMIESSQLALSCTSVNTKS